MKGFCLFTLFYIGTLNLGLSQYIFRIPEKSSSNYTWKKRSYKPGKKAPYFIKEDPFVLCVGTLEKPKKRKTPAYKRVGYSFEHGPETIITIMPPIKFTFDIFPMDNTFFIGADLSGNGLDGVWGNVGTHIGYQHESLLLQIDSDITFIAATSADGQQLSINPKIGFVRHGFFMKGGPSFIVAHTFEESLVDIFSFVKIGPIPINLELGYYLKLPY